MLPTDRSFPENWSLQKSMRQLFPLVFLFLSVQASVGDTQLGGLRCDLRESPLAVDRPDPLLSWRMEGKRRGLSQQAYHIQAASSSVQLASPDLWDSGWVIDSESIGIEYRGKPFASKQRVYWRVRIKDDQGTVTRWSEPAWFEGGLLKDEDWQGARWIACTRELMPEYGPSNVMGPWIAAGIDDKTGSEISYKFRFSLPDKHVVYAGAWWNHASKGKIELFVNGLKGLSGPEGPATIYYKDYSFYMQQENEVSISLTEADLSTPVSFGMKIVFADGSEKIIQTSSAWMAEIGQRQVPAKVFCEYDKPPLGKAQISPRAPLEVAWYKKDFQIAKQVAAARLYVCGLGYNEPYLNGEKVGDHVLAPGQTDYKEFAHYSVFDVSNQIRSGNNALSILLGDGWYNNDRWFSHSRYLYGKPGLRAFLDIRYEDGTSEKVVSNEDWHWKGSGITMSNLFLGDYVDFRKRHSEWKQSGTPEGWAPVQTIKALSPKLIAQDFPPIRVVREIEPIKTWQVGAKTWIVDLGQNISGWIALDFHEPAGTVLRLRCVEMLEENGKHLDNVPESFWSCHSSPQHHRIIADGKPQSWRPYFSYHGFRFAEIHGLSQRPTPGQIKGLVVHTDTEVQATFKSSDPLLDRIFDMGVQTHLNNMHSVLEDCPHREKCQWGGDLHSSWATGFHALDSASFYRQQVRLFYTPPVDRRGIPGRVGVGRRATNTTVDFTWSVSPLFLAWQNYRHNGDLQTAADQYSAMRQFLRYFEEHSPDFIPHIYRYGDHASPIGIPRMEADAQLIAALNFFAAANRFRDLAEALEKPRDALWGRELAQHIRESILDKYFDRKHKTFGNGTHDSLALAFGLVSPDEEEAVAASLARVYQENGAKFDGGFMSYYIYPMLTEHGYVDLALGMLQNSDYPGIAQSIRDYDATTIFERFRNDSRDKQLRHSLDHHAMNHPSAWMLNYLAGIRRHSERAGFQRLLLQPFIPKNLGWVEASVTTPYGVAKSSWRQERGRVNWSFTIPANSVAELRLPFGLGNIELDGKVTSLSDGKLVLSSGTYQANWDRSSEGQKSETVSSSVVRPPEGRLAIVIDGNSPDPDDIGATAVMFGLLGKTGLQDRLVHVSHSCDLRPTSRISKADELRRQKVLDQICRIGRTQFGPFKNLHSQFNCRQEQEAAVLHLRDAINASSPESPLWIAEAGEPDVIGYALQKADQSKLKYVHVISHHPANDNSGDYFKWADILNFGITEHQIGDQNLLLQTKKQPWDWAKQHPEAGIAWIWDCLQYAEKDGVVKFQNNKFDCSDAGMVYWWLTGADQGGAKRPTPEDIKKVLLREQ